MSVVHTFSNYNSISGMGESDISYDITPDNHVSITWLQLGTDRYSGIELFDRKMNFIRQLAQAGGHMHYTRDLDGQEVLVWFNANDPTPVAPNAVVKIRLSTGQQFPLLSLDWSLAVHISATDSSGYVFVETYAPTDPGPRSGWVPYANELLQVKLDGKEVRRLAHHRSRPLDTYNYQPRLSVSRDGSRLIYSSNFGLQRLLRLPNIYQNYTDVYLISPQQGPQLEFIPNTKSAPLPRKSPTSVTYPLSIGTPKS